MNCRGTFRRHASRRISRRKRSRAPAVRDRRRAGWRFTGSRSLCSRYSASRPLRCRGGSGWRLFQSGSQRCWVGPESRDSLHRSSGDVDCNRAATVRERRLAVLGPSNKRPLPYGRGSIGDGHLVPTTSKPPRQASYSRIVQSRLRRWQVARRRSSSQSATLPADSLPVPCGNPARL